MRIMRIALLGWMALFVAASQILAAGGAPSAPPLPTANNDPNAFFSHLTNGKEVWVRSEITEESIKSGFDRMAEKIGVTNGIITREQYIAYRQQRLISERTGSVLWNSPSNSNGTEKGTSSFNRSSEGQYYPAQTATPAIEGRKITGYTKKNLPKDLPTWFRALDTDGDGQIGLYEWKASGRSIQEFKQYDRNNDGFITVEEVQFFMARQAKKESADENNSPNGKLTIYGKSGPPPSLPGIDKSLVDRLNSAGRKPATQKGPDLRSKD